MPTFTFNNQSEGSSYVVLDPEFNTNPVLSTVPKYFSSISFSNLTNISEDDIVVNDYKIGIVVPEGNSSFEFTPSTSVPVSDVIIRGAGDCSVIYQDGATTINVSPSELNRREEESPLFTNPFCFEFNGTSDSVKIAGSTSALNMPGALSISAWVTLDPQIFNTGSLPITTQDYVIVDKADNNITEGYSLFIRKDQPSAPSAIRIRTKLGVSGNSDFQRTIQVDIQPGATNELQANTPYHIATTFDGNQIMKLYINGNEVAAKPINQPGIIQSTTEPFCIGNATAIPPPGVKEYAGKIDEVSIWDIELQPPDIASIYDWNTNGDLNNFTPSGGTSANLKAWYRMGENATFDVGLGNWTLKSANDLTNTDLELTSTGVAQTDIKTPGLVGPA